jgi:hypothetical protein
MTTMDMLRDRLFEKLENIEPNKLSSVFLYNILEIS